MADGLSYFPLFYDQRDLLQELSSDEVKRLLMALFDFFEYGVVFEDEDRSMRFAFRELRKSAENCANNYKKRCETNRLNGAKGGRPKTEETSMEQEEREKTEENRKNPTKPNETEKTQKTQYKEKEEEKEKEKDKDKEKEEQKETAQRNAAYFERFWSAYPRKQNKVNARKAFDKLRADESVLNTMLSALEQQKRSVEWTKDNGAFIPHAATWLNGRRWEDELEVVVGDSRASTYDIHAFDEMTFLNELEECG